MMMVIDEDDTISKRSLWNWNNANLDGISYFSKAGKIDWADRSQNKLIFIDWYVRSTDCVIGPSTHTHKMETIRSKPFSMDRT